MREARPSDGARPYYIRYRMNTKVSIEWILENLHLSLKRPPPPELVRARRAQLMKKGGGSVRINGPRKITPRGAITLISYRITPALKFPSQKAPGRRLK